MDDPKTARTLYAITDQHTVQRVSAYPREASGAEDGELWWVPALGYTMWLDRHLFHTPEMAKTALAAQLRAKVETLRAALAALDS